MIQFTSNPTRSCLALQVWQNLLTSSPAIKLEMRNSKVLFIFSLGKLNPKEEKFYVIVQILFPTDQVIWQ